MLKGSGVFDVNTAKVLVVDVVVSLEKVVVVDCSEEVVVLVVLVDSSELVVDVLDVVSVVCSGVVEVVPIEVLAA